MHIAIFHMKSACLLCCTICFLCAGYKFAELNAASSACRNYLLMQEVANDIKPKLHFYNIPVSADVSDPLSPLTIIQQIYHPGDFIVRMVHCMLISRVVNWGATLTEPMHHAGTET